MEGAPREAAPLPAGPPHPASSSALAVALIIPSTPPITRTLVELAVDGQKQLDTVVEAAHDILLSLNRALCSPSFWVAPSLQSGVVATASATPAAGVMAAGVGPGVAAIAAPPASGGVVGAGGGGGETGEAGSDEKAPDSSTEGLAALDATRIRYKTATAALRATVAAIVKQTQTVRAEGDVPAAENMDTDSDYLERRAADLREEVEKKNMVVKLHIDQLRTLLADVFMWQTTGL